MSAEHTKLDAVSAGREFVASAMDELGLPHEALSANSSLSDNELLEEALAERLTDKGLL